MSLELHRQFRFQMFPPEEVAINILKPWCEPTNRSERSEKPWRIYFTHCTSKKNDSLKDTGSRVTPDILYVGKQTRSFMNRCKEKGVEWAIFSDLYGMWFPNTKHEWYEKSPNKIGPAELTLLVEDSFEMLKFEMLNGYDEICFYANYKSSRFHHIYRDLVRRLRCKGLNIKYISHLRDIL